MYAQKTIQIGTIGIAQVAQPALAVVWSFLLLGEVVNDRQVVGHRDRHGRAARLRRAQPARRPAGQAICLTERASVRSRSVMKCEAARIRRSAASHRSRAVATSPASAAMRASASSAKTSTGASSSARAASRIAASRGSAPGTPSSRVERRQQAVAERGLLAAAGVAVPRRRGLERRPRLGGPPERAQDAPEMDAGERGQADVAGRLGLLDRELERGRARRVVAGLALRAPEARDLVGLGLLEAEPAPTSPPPGRCGGRRRRSGARRGPARRASRRGGRASHGSSTAPSQCCDLVARLGGARAVAGRDRGPGGEERVRGLVPRPVEPVVERPAARGELQRLLPVAVMRDDVGEVVAAARLELGVVDRVRERGRGGHVPARRLEVAGRRLDPAGEQQRAGPVARRGRLARGVERGQDPLRAPAVAEDDPRPAEAVDDAQRALRVVRGAPRQRGVDVGPLGAGEREVLGLAGAADAGAWTTRPRRRTTRRARRGRGRSARRPPSPRARTRGCCRAAGSGARPGAVVDDDERAGREPPDDVDRRRPRDVERLEDGLDGRRAARRR